MVDWAFGAGDQAVTFVSRLDRDWYLEHRWSYYKRTGGLGVTPGHQSFEGAEFEVHGGIRYRVFSPGTEILSCFGCHSTGPLGLGADYEIVPSEAGVRCEACHGGGAPHIEAASAGQLALAKERILNPGRFGPQQLVAYCGACHRPPQSDGEQIDWADPWNVRHQPLYLSRSRCFTQSENLRCINCHDPHSPLVRNQPAHYNARCLACHTSERPPAEVCPPSEASACSTCHMPLVRPQAELGFANHWIGVYREGAPLDPLGSAGGD